ncbi:unnamed protein product [Closterium sp. Yama58-4]|nr:unnamed protein product [Closterium sp. Yama58-4]
MARTSCSRVPQRAGRRIPQLPPHPRPVPADPPQPPAFPPPALAPADPLPPRVPLPAKAVTKEVTITKGVATGALKARAEKPRVTTPGAVTAATDAGRAAGSRAGSAADGLAEAADGSQTTGGPSTGFKEEEWQQQLALFAGDSSRREMVLTGKESRRYEQDIKRIASQFRLHREMGLTGKENIKRIAAQFRLHREVSFELREMVLTGKESRRYEQAIKEDRCSIPPAQASPEGASMLALRQSLPAWKERERLLQAVRDNQVVVVSGETGCGKTTQLPQYLLEDAVESGQGAQSSIICTQPRRISAVAVAERVAAERGESIGQSVGYQVRLEARRSRATHLLFCTTGVLLRRLASDPLLTGVTHIVVDEIHERGMNEDFLLIVLRDLLPRRSDLKLVLMSATLNADLFSQYFNGAPTLHIPGFTYPVRSYFLEDVLELTGHEVTLYNQVDDYGSEQQWKRRRQMALMEKRRKSLEPSFVQEALANHSFASHSPFVQRSMERWTGEGVGFSLIESALEFAEREEEPREGKQDAAGVVGSRDAGAVLVFMTGWDDIIGMRDRLREHPLLGDESRVLLLTCHGSMPIEEQKLIFNPPPPGVTKVILATNMAETSITINDVALVIDTGKAKETSYDAVNNVPCLLPQWVSKASVKQRRGRAGRVRPGVCFHLYPRPLFAALPEYGQPELLRAPLHSLCLQIKTLGLGNIGEFLGKAIQPPEPLAVSWGLFNWWIRICLQIKTLGLGNIGEFLGKAIQPPEPLAGSWGLFNWWIRICLQIKTLGLGNIGEFLEKAIQPPEPLAVSWGLFNWWIRICLQIKTLGLGNIGEFLGKAIQPPEPLAVSWGLFNWWIRICLQIKTLGLGNIGEFLGKAIQPPEPLAVSWGLFNWWIRICLQIKTLGLGNIGEFLGKAIQPPEPLAVSWGLFNWWIRICLQIKTLGLGNIGEFLGKAIQPPEPLAGSWGLFNWWIRICLQIKTLGLGNIGEFLGKAIQPPEPLAVSWGLFNWWIRICLQIKTLGLGNIGEFLGKAIQPPEPLAVDNAIELLEDVGALDKDENLTPLGRHLTTLRGEDAGDGGGAVVACMNSLLSSVLLPVPINPSCNPLSGRHLTALPLEPRVGKMLVMAAVLSCVNPVLTVAATLSEREPWVRPADKREVADSVRLRFAGDDFSDHFAAVRAFEGWVAALGSGTSRSDGTAALGSATSRSDGYSAARAYCYNHFLSHPTMQARAGVMDTS